ncbi:MAG: Trk system potassium transporter TrkA [Candidatus Limivicinus sp.]|nr:Trk system potassium transporter TrkA [Clostridiales bacterium]MDY3859772.1 Trk system potassium transporter TrkA [Candidatus Limivicinus sp.]
MKIIIAGAGKIGFSVASILSDEGHDITVIDNNPSTINNLSNNLDVICIEGSATNSETLREAGAADADLIMAAMRSDEMNMVCGISARKLGTRHVIARIRDTGYLRQTEFLREALGLSVIVNPELECAREISRILRFPSAIRVDAFSKGSAEIIEHRVIPGSKLDGMQLKDMLSAFNAKVLIGVVERGGEALIPNGNFTLQAGDLFSATGDTRELRRFFTAAGQYRKPVRSVMIMGGGRIAVHLSRLLQDVGISVTIVEADRQRCDELCDLLPDARIIYGDATRGDILLEEGLKAADAFVALTGDDGDNIITSLYAKRCGVGKIVVKVNREYYSDILESSGLDSVVTPKTLISQQLARYVRAMSNSVGSSMETLYRLAEGKVEALEFKVAEGAACVGVPLKTLRLKPNILISAIVRGNRTIIPDGETVISPGDHAVIVTRSGWLKNLDSIVEGH